MHWSVFHSLEAIMQSTRAHLPAQQTPGLRCFGALQSGLWQFNKCFGLRVM